MKQKTLKVLNTFFLLLLFFSLSLPLKSYSQNSDYYTRTYDISGFSELFLEGAFGVELIQGNKSSLEVRAADEQAFDYLNVTNRRELLHLHVDRKPFDFSKVTLMVTF
jgi:hypothetical protein